MSIENMVVNMVTQARIASLSNDNESYPKAQISYLRKAVDVTRLNPYPIVSQPPSRSLGLKLNVQGQEGNRYAFFHDMLNRLKPLKEGEGGIHNSLTNSYILLESNKDIHAVSLRDLVNDITRDVLQNIGGNMTRNIGGDSQSNIDGDLGIDVAGNMTLDVDGTIDSEFGGTATLTGNIILNGNLTVNGILTDKNGVVIETHVHPENDSGGPTDGPQNP